MHREANVPHYIFHLPNHFSMSCIQLEHSFLLTSHVIVEVDVRVFFELLSMYSTTLSMPIISMGSAIVCINGGSGTWGRRERDNAYLPSKIILFFSIVIFCKCDNKRYTYKAYLQYSMRAMLNTFSHCVK